jgi:hypothetical protein
MRAVLRPPIAALIAQHAAARAPAQRTAAVVVQEVHNVEVRQPPGCPSTSRIVVRADARMDVDAVVGAIRDLALDVVVDGITAAVADATVQRLGTTVVLTEDTRKQLADALVHRGDVAIFRDVRTNQVIRYVTADVCDLELSNDFVMGVVSRSMADAAIDVILAAEEYRRVAPPENDPAGATTVTVPPPPPPKDTGWQVAGMHSSTAVQCTPESYALAASIAALLAVLLLVALRRRPRRGVTAGTER